ncbi:MAG: acetolactate synthase large subunit [Mycobacterium sp.]|jgi:acetolactate synthase-1/2/3 large subunit|nr:acetolactate synthase large subunit [Mycobacterium sp.]
MVLVWEDGGYRWIEWKIDLELGEHHYLAFTNPDVAKYAESFGAKGYRVSSTALDQEGVSIIACPVDYAENLRLTDALRQLDGAL